MTLKGLSCGNFRFFSSVGAFSSSSEFSISLSFCPLLRFGFESHCGFGIMHYERIFWVWPVSFELLLSSLML